MHSYSADLGKCWYGTYEFVVLVAEFLAHELGHPVVAGVAVFGLETGDNEGHGGVGR